MTPYFPAEGLKAGDVLLMKGIGQVSDLIAWFGDSIYSHAAIMCSSTHFVEAANPTSREVALADRLQQTEYYDFIDAWRPTNSQGLALNNAQRQALADSVMQQLDVPYPLNDLLQLAVFAVLRNKIPMDDKLRWLLHELINLLLKFDPGHMVCSELVYYAMQQAKLPPTILVAAELDQPFPDIDVTKLIEEWLQDRHSNADSVSLAAPPAQPSISSSVLDQHYQTFRKQRMTSTPGFNPYPISDPNPANVMPVDIETSPQLRCLGRLALGRS
ncbi:hypothetical protein IC757_11905 [Wenzhouxiangella sp. AB-CW3]|uniref:hypothetical protein n=1 Tax=Wenzhouxiangella sp. AB-CW3 TaxID=2771012 RepID=UPI00168ACB6A|nr:hypothetical protein [Wenzhouxiangella sp. AB-CW3]QOC21741.1 hypothetical protein IC757_11905 [Wenzhouxiangella sp. AB-CW3]